MAAPLQSPAGPVQALLAARRLTRGDRVTPPRRVLPCALPAVARVLPSGGLVRGGLTELIGVGGHHSLALALLADASRLGPVAALAGETVYNALRLVQAGARLAHCHFLAEADPDHLHWSARQVITSGLFSLVLVSGSDWRTGELRLGPQAWRRLYGTCRQHHDTALLLVLDDHPSLQAFGRPCDLRLYIKEATRAPAGGRLLSVAVTRQAGGPPGPWTGVEVPA